MTGCDCPHGPSEHAPIADFGLSMCLVHDCDCEGTRDQVAALNAERIRFKPVGERLNDLIRAHVDEETARRLTAAILGEFEVTR